MLPPKTHYEPGYKIDCPCGSRYEKVRCKTEGGNPPQTPPRIICEIQDYSHEKHGRLHHA